MDVKKSKIKIIKRPARIFIDEKGRYIKVNGKRTYIKTKQQMSNKQLVNVVVKNIIQEQKKKVKPRKGRYIKRIIPKMVNIKEEQKKENRINILKDNLDFNKRLINILQPVRPLPNYFTEPRPSAIPAPTAPVNIVVSKDKEKIEVKPKPETKKSIEIQTDKPEIPLLEFANGKRIKIKPPIPPKPSKPLIKTPNLDKFIKDIETQTEPVIIDEKQRDKIFKEIEELENDKNGRIEDIKQINKELQDLIEKYNNEKEKYDNLLVEVRNLDYTKENIINAQKQLNKQHDDMVKALQPIAIKIKEAEARNDELIFENNKLGKANQIIAQKAYDLTKEIKQNEKQLQEQKKMMIEQTGQIRGQEEEMKQQKEELGKVKEKLQEKQLTEIIDNKIGALGRKPNGQKARDLVINYYTDLLEIPPNTKNMNEIFKEIYKKYPQDFNYIINNNATDIIKFMTAEPEEEAKEEREFQIVAEKPQQKIFNKIYDIPVNDRVKMMDALLQNSDLLAQTHPELVEYDPESDASYWKEGVDFNKVYNVLSKDEIYKPIMATILYTEPKEFIKNLNQFVDYQTQFIEDKPQQELQIAQGNSKETAKALWNYEINEYMKPFKKDGYLGTIPNDKLNLLLPSIKPHKPFSFIMNTNPAHIQKGGHWIAININNDSLEYFDPLADPPTKKFNEDIKLLIDKMKPNVYLKYKINKIKKQSDYTSTCGYHAMNFLIDRYNGIEFKDSTGYSDIKRGEGQANKLMHKLDKQSGFGYI